MEIRTANRKLLWAVYSTVLLLGAMVIVVGLLDAKAHLAFGGLVMLLLGMLFILSDYALRPTPDGGVASRAEKTAWSMLTFCIAAMLVLGGMMFGTYKPGIAAYLIFGTYVLFVLFLPAFRRTYLEQQLGRREVLEDERDSAIRSLGVGWAKRGMEAGIAMLAVVSLAFPQVIRGLENPFQVGALLLMLILVANALGEAVIASLYWHDRR